MKLFRMTVLALLISMLAISAAGAESIFPLLTPAPTAPAPAATPAPAAAPSYGMMANAAADEVTQNAQGDAVVIYRSVSADGFNAFGEYLFRRGFSVTASEAQDGQLAYALTDGKVDFVMFYRMEEQRMTLVYPRGTAYEQPPFPGYQALAYGEEIYVPNLGKCKFVDFALNREAGLVGMVSGKYTDWYYDVNGRLNFEKKKTYTRLGFQFYNTTSGELQFCDTANDLFSITLYCVNEYGTYSYAQSTQGSYNSRLNLFINGYRKPFEGGYSMSCPLKSLTETYKYVFFDLPSGVRASTDGTIYAMIEFSTGEKYVMMLRENGVDLTLAAAKPTA